MSSSPSSGQNVCPDELEQSFAALPRVRELCVLGVSPPGRGEEIHLVAVPEEGPGRDSAEADNAICQAVARVAATLPSHQRPHRVHIRREALPRTSTLKLKRRLLRDELLGRLQESATPPEWSQPAQLRWAFRGRTTARRWQQSEAFSSPFWAIPNELLVLARPTTFSSTWVWTASHCTRLSWKWKRSPGGPYPPTSHGSGCGSATYCPVWKT